MIYGIDVFEDMLDKNPELKKEYQAETTIIKNELKAFVVAKRVQKDLVKILAFVDYKEYCEYRDIQGLTGKQLLKFVSEYEFNLLKGQFLKK